jgi:hypothetical protein
LVANNPNAAKDQEASTVRHASSSTDLDSCGKMPQFAGMSKSIRVSDELLDTAKAAGRTYHRSPPQQIEYWAKLGRVMESTLSWPVLDKVVRWGQPEDIDRLIEDVDMPEAKKRARATIRATSGRIRASDT